MKIIKKLTFVIIALIFISCGNKAKDKQVQEEMENAVEILKDIPAMKKEVEAKKEAIENADFEGKLSMIVNDKGMILSTWDKNRSYINFFDERIVVKAGRKKSLQQSLAIKMNGKNLYNGVVQQLFTMNKGIETGSFIEFTFYDDKVGETGSPINATDGEFILYKVNNGDFKLSYKGKAMQGKYENKKEVDISFDFYMKFGEALIKDNRTK